MVQRVHGLLFLACLKMGVTIIIRHEGMCVHIVGPSTEEYVQQL